MFKDQKRYKELVDPLLKGDYPTKGLNQAVAVAAMCLQEDASTRPMMTDVVTALSFLLSLSAKESSAQSATRQDSKHSDRSILDKDIADDRQRAVQEAIEWGASSRHHQMFKYDDDQRDSF